VSEFERFAEFLQLELADSYQQCEYYAATPSSILLAVLNAVATARTKAQGESMNEKVDRQLMNHDALAELAALRELVAELAKQLERAVMIVKCTWFTSWRSMEMFDTFDAVLARARALQDETVAARIEKGEKA